MTDQSIQHYLDITDQICPMTFVRTKLLLERMRSGEVAEVRLNVGEPLENVPRSVREHGHEVIALAPEPGAGGQGPYLLRLRKR